MSNLTDELRGKIKDMNLFTKLGWNPRSSLSSLPECDLGSVTAVEISDFSARQIATGLEAGLCPAQPSAPRQPADSELPSALPPLP